MASHDAPPRWRRRERAARGIEVPAPVLPAGGPTERAEVAWRRDDVRDFLRHIFWVPIHHGITQRWTAEHAPGWHHDELLRALWDADALAPDAHHISGLRPVDGLEWVRLAPDGRRIAIRFAADGPEEEDGAMR